MKDGGECKEDRNSAFGLPVLFGSRRRTQLLGVLANEYQNAVTPTKIVTETDFNYQSLYNHLNPLTELGVLQTNDTQKTTYYQLRPKLTTTETLVELHDHVLNRGLISSPDTFEPLFSSKGKAKLLSGITQLEGNTFTQPAVTDSVDISTASFYSSVSELEELGVVASNGKDGKAVRYEVENSELWRLLTKLEQTICTEVPTRKTQSESKS